MTKPRRKILKTYAVSESTIKKKHQQLPQEVGDILRSLSDKKERYNYASDLVRAGWTLTAIAKELGVTREAVRVGVSNHKDNTVDRGWYSLPIPTPEKYVVVKKENKSIDEDIVKRLVELHAMAKQVRYTHTKYRKEAEVYTKLIYELYSEGYSLTEIANAVGVKQVGGLYSRLVRYGYLESTSPSRSLKKLKHRTKASPL